MATRGRLRAELQMRSRVPSLRPFSQMDAVDRGSLAWFFGRWHGGSSWTKPLPRAKLSGAVGLHPPPSGIRANAIITGIDVGRRSASVMAPPDNGDQLTDKLITEAHQGLPPRANVILRCDPVGFFPDSSDLFLLLFFLCRVCLSDAPDALEIKPPRHPGALI